MIKNPEIMAEFERQYIRSEKMDHSDALRLFEEMWQEGILLGVLPLKNPLEGIEADLRIAAILNHV